jgi:hypothetical protein
MHRPHHMARPSPRRHSWPSDLVRTVAHHFLKCGGESVSGGLSFDLKESPSPLERIWRVDGQGGWGFWEVGVVMVLI